MESCIENVQQNSVQTSVKTPAVIIWLSILHHNICYANVKIRILFFSVVSLYSIYYIYVTHYSNDLLSEINIAVSNSDNMNKAYIVIVLHSRAIH